MDIMQEKKEFGDNGMNFDESIEQENYMTYSSYLSLVEESGCTQEKAMELLSLTEEKIASFRMQFDPKEEEYKDDCDEINISQIFHKILLSKSSIEIKKLRYLIEIQTNIYFDTKKYPKMNFKLSSDEILKFKNGDYSTYLTDPLAKLLYAMAWKQGDLPKLKHIINGILNSGNENDEYAGAQVFYQFGKHLAHPELEPIVDQHVLRAFSVYKYGNEIKPNDKQQIFDYKSWLNGLIINNEEDRTWFLYEIDKLLFVIGKAIKPSKGKSNS
jgi:hypothetical protein